MKIYRLAENEKAGEVAKIFEGNKKWTIKKEVLIKGLDNQKNERFKYNKV